MKKFNRLLSMLLVVVMLAGLMTITAGAESGTTQVTWDGNGGYYIDEGVDTKSKTVPKTTGETYSTASRWAREGYTLSGWKLNNEGDPVTSYTAKGDAMTFYAVWTPNNYTITFKDGEKEKTEVFPYDSKVTAPTWTKEGYTLSWNPEVPATMPANNDTVCNAVWTPVKYSITYYLNSGVDPANPATYTFETETITLKNPTRNGYDFGGWFSNAKFEGTAVTTIEKGSTGDKSFYAKWIPNAYYTVSFNLMDGTADAAIVDQKVAYNGYASKPNVQVSKENYAFRGWCTDEACTTEFAFDFTPVTGNMTLYAKWVKSPVTVSFNSDGGSAVVPQSVQEGAKATKPSDPTKEGYNFLGWYAAGATTAFDFNTFIHSDITLTAKWEKKAPAIATVDLDEIAVKYLVQKDTLPKNYKETYTVNVYEYGPGYGYRGYRTGKYVATLSATFGKMKPMQDPNHVRPGYTQGIGKYFGSIIKAPVLDEFKNVYKKTLSKEMSVVNGKSTLTFDKEGVYVYKLVETDNRTPYMEYVSAAYLKIVVTKNSDGNLVATYTPVKITNVYDKNANVNGADNSSVKLTKVDSVDKTKVLQGAEFKLYQEGKYQNYEYFKTYTTDYNGEIEIYNLAAGDYYFVEVTAPVGYELDDSKIEFTIGKTAKTNDVELTVTNKKINIFTEEHFAYIQGYEDGTVRPQNNITRAEAATILFRLLNDNVRAQYWDTVSSYADVPVNAWYNNAVATLENMGVLEVGANYRPNDYITRAELAFMITNFYDLSALDIDSVYLSDIAGHVYETAIKQAAAMGWVKGYIDSSFNPNANITRAEAMTLINRVLERAVEERGMCAGMKTFPDNPVSAWYYEDVQEATNSHTYTRTTTLVEGYDFYYESWGSIQANPDWTALETTWAK